MLSYYIVVSSFVILSQFGNCKCNEHFNVFDKIKSGFQMAGEFFSTDHASKVANLVSKALGGNSPHGKAEEKPTNIFSGFLRLFGFESRQISAIAVNAIILIAQLIGSSLKPPSKLEHQKVADDNPFEWIMKNNAITDIISDTKDEKLSEKVIEYVAERSLDEETGCIQLLVCKMKPFISEMQRALRERGKSGVKGIGALYEYFPNSTVIEDNGDKCEKKYYYCSIPF